MIRRLLAGLVLGLVPAVSQGQTSPVVLRAARVLDGRGGATAGAP